MSRYALVLVRAIIAVLILLPSVTPTFAQTLPANVLAARPLDPGESRPIKDGRSWATAYVNLQEALDFRATQPIISQTWSIWVSGKHIPPISTRTQLGVARTETFRKLRQNTRILGGFAGTETSEAQRSPSQNPTVLSGDVGTATDSSDNTFTLVTIGNIDGSVPGVADTTLVFDGLTLQDGVANTTGRYTASCVNFFGNFSAKFVNCVFQNNAAGSPGATNGQGAAVVLQNNGRPEFVGCTFRNNFSNGEGGAVWIANAPLGATFTNCVFDGNQSRTAGAVYLIGNPIVMEGCVFTNNSAALLGGALVRVQGGSVTATNCDFVGNTAGVIAPGVVVGGGDFAEGGAISLQSTNTLQATDRFTNCRLNFNTVAAQGGPWNGAANRGAGAIHHVNGVLILSGCQFIENPLPNLSNALGAALRAYSTASDNYTLGSRVRIDKSTFQDNTSPGGRGGAINTYRGQLDVYSTVFFRNSSRGDGTAIFYEDPPIISGSTRASILLANSLFHANTCTRTGPACTATSNGAVAAQGDSRIINCTFVNNTATQSGGVMLLQINGSVVPNPVVANSILTGNVNLAALPQGRPFAANLNTDAGNSTFTFVSGNCIGGNYPVNGNIAVDPRFVDADGADNIPGSADDNYRLALNSPCLDAADSSKIPPDAADLDADGNTTEPLPLDLDGMPRRQDVPDAPDVGFGGAPVPDMGCNEALPLASVSFWSNPVGGAFALDSNWTPQTAPPQNGTAVFDLNTAYTVTIAADRTINSFEVRTDQVTFSLNNSTLTAAGFPSIIGRRADDQGDLTIDSGRLSLSTLRLAEGAHSAASLDLPNAASTIACSSSLVVGALGQASLSIRQGASSSALITTVGEQPGSSGLLTITGAGSKHRSDLLTQIQRGTVDVRSGGSLDAGLLGALVLQDARVVGDGIITGPVFNFGTLAPSAVAPTSLGADDSFFSIGTLTLASGYQQIGTVGSGRDSGTLEIDLDASGNDRLEVIGNASLAGGLLVSKAPAFEPPPNNVIGSPTPYRATILRADTLGQGVNNRIFDVAIFPALSTPNRYFQLETSSSGGRQEINIVQAILTGDLATGNGTNYAAAGQPTDAVLADLDADSFPDLILSIPGTQGSNGSVTILRNAGVDSQSQNWLGFAPPSSQISIDSGGVNPVDIAVADFDDDARHLPDIIVVNRGSNNYRVILNQTPAQPNAPIAMVPRPARTLSAPPGGVTAINYYDIPASAHRVDAVITLQRASTNGTVVPLLNTGPSGSAWQDFVQESEIAVGPGPTAIASGLLENFGATTPDPNGPDLAVANYGNPAGTGDTITVLYNTGTASTPQNRFNRTANIRVGVGPNQIIFADLEGDKDTETLIAMIAVSLPAAPTSAVATAPPPQGTLSVIRKLPGGTLSPPVTFPAGYGPSSALLAKLDADEDLDIAVATRDQSGDANAIIRVFRNDTPMNTDPSSTPLVFTQRTPDISTGQNSSIIAAADIDQDQDHDQDIVVINGESLFNVLAGLPGNADTARVTVVPNTTPTADCTGDFNNDRSVNSIDLVYFLARFGQDVAPGSPEARADFNDDGTVNVLDLTRFLGRFGVPCP